MTAPTAEVRAPFVQHVHDTALTAPITALEMTTWLHAMIHDLRALAVTQARLKGHSWRDIAQALDASPATIHRRFSHLDPRP